MAGVMASVVAGRIAGADASALRIEAAREACRAPHELGIARIQFLGEDDGDGRPIAAIYGIVAEPIGIGYAPPRRESFALLRGFLLRRLGVLYLLPVIGPS